MESPEHLSESSNESSVNLEESYYDNDDETSNMEKFDDDALVEFIRKDEKFVSIDLMI